MSFSIYYFLQLSMIFILLGWAIYLNFRNGQLYLAPIFTMGIGAYFSSYATVEWGWPFGLAFIVAISLGALAGFVPALGLGRAPPFTVSIATLGLIAIGQAVVRNSEALGYASGYYGMPRPGYIIPLSLIIVLLAGFFIYRLDHSRLGRAMGMVSVDPELASTMGISQYWLSISLQTLAGAMGAIAGVLYAFTTGSIHPQMFGLSLLLRIVCFLFVGGATTMWGIVFFAPILWSIYAFVPTAIAQETEMIYSLLLIAVLILRPDGVITRPMLQTIEAKSRFWLRQLMTLREQILTERRK